MDLRYPHDVGEGNINSAVRFTVFDRKWAMEFAATPSAMITLYVPDAISNPNTIQWNEGSLAEMGGDFVNKKMENLTASKQNLANKAQSELDAFNSLSPGQVASRFSAQSHAATGNILRAQQASASGAIDSWMKKVNLFQGAKDVLSNDKTQYYSRTIPNPYTTLLFKSVNLREFTLDFTFYPLSQSDTQTILQILNTFKSAALPVNLGAALMYPNEFTIEFLFNGSPNPYLPFFKRCVILNINTNYTGQGFWAMTRDGCPTEIKLSLTFKELEILTKEDYK